MRIAILEDNEFYRDRIIRLINTNTHIIHSYANIDAYDKSEVHYDLLLLDVHLEKESGIEYIKSTVINNHLLYTFQIMKSI